MGYLALERTRTTLEVLFTQRVQTLTDMSELRTTLGDLRRAEKDIIINFNNTIEVSAQRDLWKKSLQALNKGLADVRKVQASDASFAEAIDKALAEVKEYDTGISPVFEQIERAQIDGAVGGAEADKYKKHMEAVDKALFDLAMDARTKMDEARQGLDSLTSTMSGLIGGALLLALAVLIPLTLFSVRSITQSISQASELAERIAGGDLRDFTLVLKGMIALSATKFPKGTRSPMLDAIARAPIWAAGIDFGHGTGHGVGFFLNVHEGPQSISPSTMPEPHTAMEEGMITSIEPGIYRPGRWGIRIENLVLNQPAESDQAGGEFGQFLRFETLTLCPIDTRCLDHALLREDERAWLNDYHATVRQRLAPQLSGDALAWLHTRTEAV
eukprot:gene26867-33515_t